MTTYETRWGGDVVRIRADWAHASSQVEVEGEDGWIPTGHQVADYRHSARAAMRDVLCGYASAEGLDATERETMITAAVAAVAPGWFWGAGGMGSRKWTRPAGG